MTDLIQEIYGTIMRNKLRTALTGFSVAWGIFMLIVLLGAGNGLIHAFEGQSAGMMMNSMKIFPGYTSKPYQGMQEGRSISLNNHDREISSTAFPEHVITAGATISQSSVTLTYGKEQLSIGLDGVFPNYPELEAVKLQEGRFINERDMKERRKVIILHEKTAGTLFPKTHPIGKYIKAGGVVYQVVGIYGDQNSFSPTALVPFTTLQTVYAKGDRQPETVRPDRRQCHLDLEPLHPIPATADRHTDTAHRHLGNRNLYPVERHRGGEQHHAHYGARAHTRIRNPESTRCQADVYLMAHHLRKCNHHHLLRICGNGGRNSRHRIHECGGRQTDHGCGSVLDDILRKSYSRLVHRRPSNLDINCRRNIGRTLPSLESCKNPPDRGT